MKRTDTSSFLFQLRMTNWFCLTRYLIFSVDGQWASWAAWSTCSVTCGDGTINRDRTCDNPPPAHGGLMCEGPGSQQATCDMEPCLGISLLCKHILNILNRKKLNKKTAYNYKKVVIYQFPDSLPNILLLSVKEEFWR